MNRVLEVAFIMIVASTHSIADTRVEIRDGEGGLSSFSSNGKRVRMENDGEASYVLIDLAKHEFKMVDPHNREVMTIGGMAEAESATVPAQKVTIQLLSQGKGPTIAGFSTQKYQINVNKINCGTIFGSKKALQQKGMSDFISAMGEMEQQTSQMADEYEAGMSPCSQAHFQSVKTFETTGAPLRIMDEQGQLESEVTSINTQAKTPDGYYDDPAGFKLTSIAEKMNEATQQNQQMMQQMQNNMPDINQIMQQMQQGGEIPAEVMEQLKKMQDMLEQQSVQQ